MPRRRLHGRTQERRKKPRTRLLKRSTSAVRVQATQEPAPFERSPRVERDDLEFLEAMRELQVERSPWRGESVARRNAVERVQFLAEDQESALFLRSMTHLGVQPLQGASGASGATPPAEESAPRITPAEPAPPEGPSEGGARTTPRRATSTAGAVRDERPPLPGTTEFQMDDDAPETMEALLREGGFDTGLKFAGAAAPPRRAGVSQGTREPPDEEPDAELDLHGKTQEEAIRMVQSFLLVSHRNRLRHVLVITGRGRNSGPTGPVLKDAVYRWLELNAKRFARSFVRAPARLGGEGAIWITLR